MPNKKSQEAHFSLVFFHGGGAGCKLEGATISDLLSLPAKKWFKRSRRTVPVGNAGNVGELSGSGAGGYGPDRICGSVAYDYRIGTHEVTAGQYTEFLNAVAGTDTYGLYNSSMWSSSSGCKIQRSGTLGNYSYSVAQDWANRPVNYVSWGDSARFSNWLHNDQPTGAQSLSTTEDGAYFLNGATSDAALLTVDRESDWKWAITSEDEWHKAAHHKNDGDTGNYFNYPTSSDSINTGMANYGRSVGHTTDVGSYAAYSSRYGTFDQGGNVWEWNEAVLHDSYRGVRGGSFVTIVGYLQASARDIDGSTYECDSFGFRVASVPEPASIAMFVLGGLAVMRRRKPQA